MAPTSSNKLEKAIKASKVALLTTENGVVIDRKASRRRGKLSAISLSATSADLMDQHSTYREEETVEESVQFWKEKYEMLFGEKTAVERDLESQLVLSQKRFEKQRQYTELLEQKAALLESGARVEEPSQNSSTNAQKIRLYEKLTSMQVSVDPKDNSFQCTVKNHEKKMATVFNIYLFGNSQSPVIQFEPKVNLDMLPTYLRSNLSCEEGMGPVMMGDILQNLFEEKEDEQ